MFGFKIGDACIGPITDHHQQSHVGICIPQLILAFVDWSFHGLLMVT